MLDKTALKKQKYIRANNGPIVYKEIRKAIMERTRLRNKYLKNQYAATKNAYISQKNSSVPVVRKAQWDYCDKLDHKKLTDDETFWKTVKPFFTDKWINNKKILFIEEGQTTANNKRISKKLNNFFMVAVKNLNTPQ